MSSLPSDADPLQAPAHDPGRGGRARPILWIGEWSVDPQTNELRRGGEVVRVEPKAMDVLMRLAECVGRVVSREALFAAVWPDVVVGDEALTQSIIKLRRALGDRSRSPSYIETISKRGYRLIAPVRHSSQPEASSGDATPARGRERPAGARRPALWGGLAAGVMLLAAVVAFDHARAPDPEIVVSDAAVAAEPRQPAWLTVTVVPFESLGPEREQAYLARGISDELTTALSHLSNLRLVRESGAATEKPSASSARYRVSGSVQREAGTLRINIHVADRQSNEVLWSARFERSFDDLFAVQDEIVASVVDVLPGKVSDVERLRLAKRHTGSLEAYDLFLRAQARFLVRRNEANEEARSLYLKALALDPKFARAYTGLAMTYAMDYRLHASGDALPALDRAYELAETARLIDPDIPEVYWALGFVHAQSRRHAQAIEALQHAIELDRSFADAYALLGGIQTYTGLPAKSIPLLRTALRLNPEGGYLYFLLLGRAYLFENDIEQALINLRAALSRNPADVETRVYLAAALAAAGEDLAAQWEADEIRSLEPGFSTHRWLETYPLIAARQRDRLLALLDRVEL